MPATAASSCIVAAAKPRAANTRIAACTSWTRVLSRLASPGCGRHTLSARASGKSGIDGTPKFKASSIFIHTDHFYSNRPRKRVCHVPRSPSRLPGLRVSGAPRRAKGAGMTTAARRWLKRGALALLVLVAIAAAVLFVGDRLARQKMQRTLDIAVKAVPYREDAAAVERG